MRKLGAAIGLMGLLAGCGGHGSGSRQTAAAGQRISPESMTVAVDADESAHDQVIEARLDRLENEFTHQQVIERARSDALQAQVNGLKRTIADLVRHSAGRSGSSSTDQHDDAHPPSAPAAL